jgi:lipopolysaccharide/colanic/teichoic acid biosynthesis glycosyltransferase
MPMAMQGYLSNRVSPRARECVATYALLILVLPLMAFVALAIKCESKGPILIRRERIARGRVFVALQFRCTSHDDPFARLTRVGRFLRSVGVEKFPQLYNVLRGEMSCLNRRPEMPFFLD